MKTSLKQPTQTQYQPITNPQDIPQTVYDTLLARAEYLIDNDFTTESIDSLLVMLFNNEYAKKC